MLTTNYQPNDDVFKIVSSLRSELGNFTKAVTISKDHFISIHVTEQQIKDLVRFCVEGNSVLRVDTTFEIIENFWVTDTSYTNESLISENSGESPDFPGPIMLHFRKDTFTYQAFASHLVMINPDLKNIKKFGTDLDRALINGMRNVFEIADPLICVQHLQERDSRKLDKLSASSRSKQRILSDIYGSKQNQSLQLGLADSMDDDDFSIKLKSLKEIWDPLVPGFHSWFEEKRSQIFVTSVINSAKDRVGINSVFYNNRLEVMHKLQKKLKKEDDIPHEVVAMVKMLKEWSESYYHEAVRAVRGIGKYRLAPDFQTFAIDPVRWIRWGCDRQEQHLDAFFLFTPEVTWLFKRPANAGQKSTVVKKRRDKDEPQLFSQRIGSSASPSSNPQANKKVTPLKLRKDENGNFVASQSSGSPASSTFSAVDPLNPFRSESRLYYLVSKFDNKNCPGQVTRCEQCRFVFSNADIVLVRTTGVREFTDKNGKQRRNTGNVYLHYLKSCLTGYDDKFKFSAVTVLQETLKKLPPDSVRKFRDMGLQIEP